MGLGCAIAIAGHSRRSGPSARRPRGAVLLCKAREEVSESGVRSSTEHVSMYTSCSSRRTYWVCAQ